MSAFVLGFADEAAQIAGLAWSLAGASGALTVDAGETLLLADASDDGGRIAAGTGERRIQGDFPADGAWALTGDAAPAGSPSLVTGEVEVRLESEAMRCPAHLTRWESDPSAGAGLIRHLIVPSDGSMIVLVATRPEGSTDHASESTSSWLAGPPEGAAAFAESFLSTQYDSSGTPTRVGLELWPTGPDAHALRAAGSVAHGAESGDDGGPRVSSMVLHTSTDGFRGIGTYLVVRK